MTTIHIHDMWKKRLSHWHVGLSVLCVCECYKVQVVQVVRRHTRTGAHVVHMWER